MFKTSVVSATLYFVCAQLMTACGLSVHDSQTNLPQSLKRAIAHELVNASANHLEDGTGGIYLYSTRGNDWMQTALSDELVTRHYRISDDLNSPRRIAIEATRVGPTSVHVSLKFDNVHEVDRLFHFDPTNGPAKAFHVDRLSAVQTDYLPVPRTMQVATSESTKSVSPIVARARIPAASPVNAQKMAASSKPQQKPGCLVPVLQQGSLKQNIERFLTACGWELVEWPKDPTKPNHELDWLVPTTQRLELTSIEDLVEALRSAFDFDIELIHTARTVRVQLRK